MIIHKLIFTIVLLWNTNNLNAYRIFHLNGVETLLAMENENVTVQCKTDVPMAYCGLIHPTGKRYSFSGTTLDNGQCAITVNATASDVGQWICHIGRKDSIGVEITQKVDLRVVNQLAAVRKNVTTVHGKEVTVACVTTEGMLPLRYCRFEPPEGKAFSINSHVTASEAILGRYYFPSNMSLDRGDCAVIIKKVKYEDVGKWTCGAGLDDGQEHIDTVVIDVEGFYTMSTASATGITLGALGAAAVLGLLGFIVWKKRRLLGNGRRAERERQEMRELPQRSPSRQGQASPQPSPSATPILPHNIPIITIKSPSEAGTSPVISSS